MQNPANRDQGRSRVAHLRKVIARDVTEPGPPIPQELELEALLKYMDLKYPNWDAPPPPPVYPETLKGCKRLEARLREQMTAPAKSKRTRAEFRAALDQLLAHMAETFPA